MFYSIIDCLYKPENRIENKQNKLEKLKKTLSWLKLKDRDTFDGLLERILEIKMLHKNVENIL